uniref:Ovule protein n=1 Tax=Romanomermis culicivorax TaxID=13658 RepID=A0A915I580_ROMCU
PRFLFASHLLYTKAVKLNPFFICKPKACFSILLSSTEAAVDCLILLRCLLYPALLPYCYHRPF